MNSAKGNGLTADNSQPAKAYKQNTTHIVASAENLGKPFANLRARCALAGIALSAIENDNGKTVYIVSKWALTRELPDLESVSAWLEKVTGGRS